MTEQVQFLSRCTHCLVIVDSSSPIEHTCTNYYNDTYSDPDIRT